jgi:ribosome-binding protein aMBF1 (putative translation factor)|tara:strand:+ start:1734 stop:2048 length:315 start_codon:yes stop_codon:yes gene_type:complete
MEHQDWDQYIFKAKPSPKVHANAPKSPAIKLEEKIEEGKMTHKKMDSGYGIYIQKHRLSRGMTQKDLAQKINVPVKDINDIESGKAKHNGQLMNKINRVFYVKK